DWQSFEVAHTLQEKQAVLANVQAMTHQAKPQPHVGTATDSSVAQQADRGRRPGQTFEVG
ncbi:MAG: hypothetical protein QOH03_1466, partial [Kribbellaceae bacterium]|nr:hypothetical protein [Kribbellaceae bacterium]